VRADRTIVWDELQRVTLRALPLSYALEAVRMMPAALSGKRHKPLAGRTFFDVTPIPVLFSEPPSVVIAAGLSQAWRLLGGPTAPYLDAGQLRACSEPGWIKVGMEYRLVPDPVGTRISIETRIVTTDPKTDRAFGAYWFAIRTSSAAIRQEVLRVVARRAESAANSMS
jgi:hypothetical protein